MNKTFKSKYNIILASASPRRKELLGGFIDEFNIVVSNIDEEFKTADTENELLRVARLKSLDVFTKYSNSIVIAADTIVVKDNIIYGKPKDKVDAKRVLLELNNSMHTVLTGVHVFYPEGEIGFVRESIVEFRDNDESIIDWYLSTDEPYDKAGAYAVQGLGSILVKKIEGDYNNVVGLPIADLILLMLERKLLDIIY